MERIRLKAFFYSFSVSLLAFFTVDKVFCHTSRVSTKDLIIPNKNIVLFINQNDSTSIRAIPTKKIILSSAIPDISSPAKENIKSSSLSLATPKEPVISTAQNSPTVSSKEDKSVVYNYLPLSIELEEKHVDKKDTVLTSLSTLKKDTSSFPKESPVLVAKLEEIIPPTKISNFSNSSKELSDRLESEFNSDTSSSDEDVSTSNRADESDSLDDGFIDSNFIITADDDFSDTETENFAVTSLNKSVIANTDSSNFSNFDQKGPSESTIEKSNKQLLLIPLEKGDELRFAHNNIQSAQEGNPNQIASTNKNVPIKVIGSFEPNILLPIKKKETSPWKSMEEIEQQNASDKKKNSAWETVDSKTFPKNKLTPKTQEIPPLRKALEIKEASGNISTKEGIQVAGDMVNNLIIPIPQDILKEDNLIPQLTSSEQNMVIEKELESELGLDSLNKESNQIFDAQGRNLEKRDDKNIFSELSSIFSHDKDTEDGTSEEESERILLKSETPKKRKTHRSHILPTEIRLSFQPNRAEISGQTLQWVRAFGKKAAEEETIALEIRLNADNDFLLQQKRLDLLNNILSSRGVTPSKIKLVYSEREPNSFVMRTIRIPNLEKNSIKKNSVPQEKGYYLQW